MKIIFKMLLLAPFLLLFSCGNVKSGSEERLGEEEIFGGIEDLVGEFKITAINGEDVSSEEVTLNVNAEENTISVSAGCNILLSNYLLQDENVVVEPPVGTKMYCEGKMKNEDALAKVLPEISKLKETSDKYLFLSATNEALITVLKNDQSE